VRMPNDAAYFSLGAVDSDRQWTRTRTVTFQRAGDVGTEGETFCTNKVSTSLGAGLGVNAIALRGTPDCVQIVPGSSWGLFTIACTSPIALLVGWWMYRFRKGHVIEASLIGATLTIGAVIIGHWVPGSALEPYFSLGKGSCTLALCIYGFIASVMPVWLLLA